MIDMGSVNGNDVGILNTQIYRAANILDVQLGSLEYAQDFGADKKFFLSDEFEFQNDSFRSYLIQVLASYSINVSSVVEVIDNLSSQLQFNLTPPESDGALISR